MHRVGGCRCSSMLKLWNNLTSPRRTDNDCVGEQTLKWQQQRRNDKLHDAVLIQLLYVSVKIKRFWIQSTTRVLEIKKYQTHMSFSVFRDLCSNSCWVGCTYGDLNSAHGGRPLNRLWWVKFPIKVFNTTDNLICSYGLILHIPDPHTVLILVGGVTRSYKTRHTGCTNK